MEVGRFVVDQEQGPRAPGREALGARRGLRAGGLRLRPRLLLQRSDRPVRRVRVLRPHALRGLPRAATYPAGVLSGPAGRRGRTDRLRDGGVHASVARRGVDGPGGLRGPVHRDPGPAGRHGVDRDAAHLRAAGGRGPTGRRHRTPAGGLGPRRCLLCARLHAHLAHPVARRTPPPAVSRHGGGRTAGRIGVGGGRCRRHGLGGTGADAPAPSVPGHALPAHRGRGGCRGRGQAGRSGGVGGGQCRRGRRGDPTGGSRPRAGGDRRGGRDLAPLRLAGLRRQRLSGGRSRPGAGRPGLHPATRRPRHPGARRRGLDTDRRWSRPRWRGRRRRGDRRRWGSAGRRRLGALSPSFRARAFGIATEMVADATLEAAGAQAVGDRRLNPPDDASAHTLRRRLRSHLSLRSVWFRNAVRGAAGLALAVAVVEVTDVEHGFWVVLGTLSVLRSNALGTGATALRAVAGTAVGFVVGSPSWSVWVGTPCAVGVAAPRRAGVGRRPGDDLIRRRPGRLHRGGGDPVQHHRPRRLEGRARPGSRTWPSAAASASWSGSCSGRGGPRPHWAGRCPTPSSGAPATSPTRWTG